MHHWQVSFRFAVGGLDDFWNVGNGHCLRSDWWWEQHCQWNQRPTRGANHAGVANSTDGTTGEIDAGANETWQGYMLNLLGMRHIFSCDVFYGCVLSLWHFLVPYPDFPLFGLWYICLAMASCLRDVRRDGVTPRSYSFFDSCCDFSISPRILIKGMMVACRSVFFTLVPWQLVLVLGPVQTSSWSWFIKWLCCFFLGTLLLPPRNYGAGIICPI